MKKSKHPLIGLFFCILIIGAVACTKTENPPIVSPPPIPNIPTIILPKEGDLYGNCLLVSWQQTAFATDYTLQIAEDDVFSYNGSLVFEEKMDSSETSYMVDFRGKGSGKYYCRMKAKNSSGESIWTNPISYRISVQSVEDCIDYEPPTAPTLEMPEDSMSIEGSTVSFSWNASLKATHYQIEITSLTGTVQVFYNKGNIEETKRTVLSFPKGVYYSWHVRAFNHTAGSAWSERRVFWIEP